MDRERGGLVEGMQRSDEGMENGELGEESRSLDHEIVDDRKKDGEVVVVDRPMNGGIQLLLVNL